jgi:hypothetical protein
MVMVKTNQTQKQEQQRQYVDRRKKPDWVVRSVTIVTLFGWIGAMIALALSYLGAPKDDAIGNAINAINPNIGAGGSIPMKIGLLRGAFIAIMVSFVVCALGFILNITRHRRKTDKYNKLLITLGIVSIVFIAAFLINYAGDL